MFEINLFNPIMPDEVRILNEKRDQLKMGDINES